MPIDISDKFQPSGGVGAFMLYSLAEMDVEAPAAITLSTDRLTITAGSAACKVAAESGTADDLDGISNFNEGQFLILRADTGDTITLKDENAGAASTSDRLRLPGGEDIDITEDEAVLLYHDDTLDRWIYIGGVSARDEHVMSITVEDPADADSIAFHFNFRAVTIQETQTVIVGGTSVVWNIHHGTNRGTAATKVITSAPTESSTSGTNRTSFDDATIPADSWWLLDIGTVTGSVTEFTLVVKYTYD